MGKTSLNKSGTPRVVGRNGIVRCCTEECGYTYSRNGEPPTRGSLSDPLAYFRDPLVVWKILRKKTVTNINVVKKSLFFHTVALKTGSWVFLR